MAKMILNGIEYAGIEINDTQPIGEIIDSGSDEVPLGYLPCDGRSLLRSEYPELFKAIGTKYGAVDAQHFNLPNEEEAESVIDDNETSLEKTWSSSKIQEKINAGGWEDITSSVTLTKVSGNSNVVKMGCYLTKGFVKINFNILMTATTTAGSNISKFTFSSSRFTSSGILSRVFSSTYYGATVVTYGCNVYDGENNTITVRNSSTSNTNDEYQCCLVIPVRNN